MCYDPLRFSLSFLICSLSFITTPHYKTLEAPGTLKIGRAHWLAGCLACWPARLLSNWSPLCIMKHYMRQIHGKQKQLTNLHYKTLGAPGAWNKNKKTKRICWLVGWLAGWPAGLRAARFIRGLLLTLPVAHVARCSRCAHRARCTCCACGRPRVEGLGFRV